MSDLISMSQSAVAEAEKLSRRIYERDRTKGVLIDDAISLEAELNSAIECLDPEWIEDVGSRAEEYAGELARYKVYRFQLSSDEDGPTSVGVEFVAADLPGAIRRLMDWAPDLEYFVYKGAEKL